MMSASLGLEVGVGRSHVARQPMGPQVSLSPDALDQVLAHTEVRGKATAGPVRRPVRWRAAGGRQHPGAYARCQLPRCTSRVVARQALHAVLQEAAAPLGDGRARDVEFRGHGPCRNTLGEKQHDLGTLHEPGRQGVRACKLLELIALGSGQMNRLSFKGHIPRRRPTRKTLVVGLESLDSRAGSSATVVVGSAVVIAVLRGLLAMSAGFRSALVETAKPDRELILRNDSNNEMDGWISRRELAILEAFEGLDFASGEVYTTPPVPKRGAGTAVDVVCRGVTAAAFALRPAPRRTQASAPASY